MIIIRFPDDSDQRRAIGWLPGRFSFKSWATGQMLVPAEALSWLAMEGIRFNVEGLASPEQLGPKMRICGPIEVL